MVSYTEGIFLKRDRLEPNYSTKKKRDYNQNYTYILQVFCESIFLCKDSIFTFVTDYY